MSQQGSRLRFLPCSELVIHISECNINQNKSSLMRYLLFVVQNNEPLMFLLMLLIIHALLELTNWVQSCGPATLLNNMQNFCDNDMVKLHKICTWRGLQYLNYCFFFTPIPFSTQFSFVNGKYCKFVFQYFFTFHSQAEIQNQLIAKTEFLLT